MMRRLVDRFLLRARSLMRGGHVDAALKDEIRVHLEEQIEENLAAGMSPRPVMWLRVRRAADDRDPARRRRGAP